MIISAASIILTLSDGGSRICDFELPLYFSLPDKKGIISILLIYRMFMAYWLTCKIICLCSIFYVNIPHQKINFFVA